MKFRLSIAELLVTFVVIALLTMLVWQRVECFRMEARYKYQIYEFKQQIEELKSRLPPERNSQD